MVHFYSLRRFLLLTALFVFLSSGLSYSQPRFQTVEDIATLSNQNYILHQNYPNPFNPVTHIKYTLKQKGFVSLKVFSILGKEVNTLVSEDKQPGTYQVEFNAGNLPSGIYLYQLNVNGSIQTKRLILLR